MLGHVWSAVRPPVRGEGALAQWARRRRPANRGDPAVWLVRVQRERNSQPNRLLSAHKRERCRSGGPHYGISQGTFATKGYCMSQRGKTFVLALAGCTWLLVPAQAAEREQVRMVINLVAGVKMPFPGNLRNNVARTERVQLDTNGATVACLRLDDKQRWCYEHIAPVGARAEMLRVRSEPADGPLVGQVYHYVDDYDLDGAVDVGSTTKLEGQPYAPVGIVSQFFHRGTNRGDQFRGDYQRLYDEGIQIALKYLGE